MANPGAVQVKLELGHRAQVRKKPTVEGFTHDWVVFVRGPDHGNVQHFVEKVVFHLHESFPKPKRAGRMMVLYEGVPLLVSVEKVCKDPPYKVEESGYAGFILPIEVYFRNKEEPKKVRFDYDLFLHLDGHPPVNHLRCEKLTFNNPTEEFRKKLLKQRDPVKRSSEESKVMVMQEGSTSLFGQHMKLSTLPTSTLASGLADPKKSKSFHGSKDGSKGCGPALLTASKDHKERPSKDLKEPKNSALNRDSGWAPSNGPKEPSRKPKENQPLRDANPKIGFKEPKSLSKERRPLDGPCLESAGRQTLPPSDGQLSDRKLSKDRSRTGNSRADAGDKGDQRKAYSLPPFKDSVDPMDSDVEDGAKSDTYLDELVELHRRLMTLREGHILQQIVNLIEETGHFHITNTTFDFDLCSLDRSTVRKLQSYLDASGLS
ncbi:hypothetical protein NHX12_014476 [Muraenolepis orangiensis]|uniref:YEATS domain-containing protein n=1 Tax=Muraenolepis orangiensis TaxID=630683 RepID=A0A9Q0DCI7_9TELE|nr:hypothetical protein NHX12_014476 [Muraenolepis orangiensis]